MPLDMTIAETVIQKSIIVWERIRIESRGCVMAALAPSRRFIRYAVSAHRLQAAKRAMVEAQLDLGRRMHEIGLGDADLRRQIADVDEKISSVEAARGSNRALETERKGLTLRLAEPMLSAQSSPRLISERHAAALASRSALDEARDEVAAARTALRPTGRHEWYRVGLGSAMALGAVFLVVYLARPPGRSAPNPAPNRALPSSSLEPATISTIDREADLSGALGLVVCGFRLVEPSGKTSEIPISTGTCFSVSTDGYLITNKHVIENIWDATHADLQFKKLREEKSIDLSPMVWVFFGKEKHLARIVHVSDDYDLGILKVERRHAPNFRLAAADSIPRGTAVFALGFPFVASTPLSDREVIESARRATDQAATRRVETQFKDRDFEFVLTNGSVGRVISEGGGQRWLQHNADINPGNSGGPLVTADGLVYGINTLLIRNANGVFTSLAISQLRREIQEHVPDSAWK
jgi:S1-C subfamily serine protease